jgi:hypothetical protein
VSAQLEQVRSQQERKNQAKDATLGRFQQISISIAIAFMPSDESIQLKLDMLTLEQESLDEQLSALALKMFFLENPDGGYAKLQALRTKIAEIKTVLPATVPTPSSPEKSVSEPA